MEEGNWKVKWVTPVCTDDVLGKEDMDLHRTLNRYYNEYILKAIKNINLFYFYYNNVCRVRYYIYCTHITHTTVSLAFICVYYKCKIERITVRKWNDSFSVILARRSNAYIGVDGIVSYLQILLNTHDFTEIIEKMLIHNCIITKSALHYIAILQDVKVE